MTPAITTQATSAATTARWGSTNRLSASPNGCGTQRTFATTSVTIPDRVALAAPNVHTPILSSKNEQIMAGTAAIKASRARLV